MENKQKNFIGTMLAFIISMFLLIAFCGNSNAADCNDPQYSLDQENISKCIVFGEQLEQCKYISQSQDELINEMQKKMDTIELADQKLLQAIVAQEQAINSYKEIVKLKNEQITLREKQCKEDIKKAKPGFFQKLGWFGSGTLTGAILTIVGLMAL